jgi:hypothetical protein
LVTNDFYEPRSTDEKLFVNIPEYISSYVYFSSNYNRKFALDINPSYAFINQKDRVNYGISISPRYRFDDHFSLVYNFGFNRQNKNIGWASIDDSNNTIFSRRDRITYTNTLQGKYSINNKMNLSLSIRHYWSYVITHNYLTLQNDGSLVDNTTFTGNTNQNLNLWNLDLSYSWWFAPGSQISILFRNNSALSSQDFNHRFDSTFTKAIDNQNLKHTLSISVRYFIDYNSVKNATVFGAITKPKTREHF